MAGAVKRYLKNRLSAEQLDVARRRVAFIKSFFYLNDFMKLAKIYCPGKTDHTYKGFSYAKVYEKYFEPLRKRNINLLEIGVDRGCSLRLWKRYFTKANIYGIDIDPQAKQFEEKRIFIEIGSQTDDNVLGRVCDKAKEFDIIIDDGSHVNKHMIKSFNYLFKKLRAGGLYIIEDLGNSYLKLDDDYYVRERWKGMKHNAAGEVLNNDRREMNEFFNKIIHDMDHKEGDVVSISFWTYLCVIVKG